ncbi:aldehyde dehydrogenase family protein [Conexibacter woesei]|uniref:Aldehyde Dehydrogenase n=1 Tax=Conexibacter woesei (strain DSM 14684 / CCUG 47730 / CIP 108061 / JCM 11494 / NBRC 100937 / ID131577) TaxID=469383 RepID=D3F8U0_CONWI|nr:aldehyde dehydrogenase family protein [Conexibacter woesei]ADB51054.1 Aldehyde Dehydrogenase [Conexibacter woesei DSM 14684]
MTTGLEQPGTAGRALDVFSPADPAERVGSVPVSTAADVRRVCDAAAAAAERWAATPAPHRGTVLHRAATLLDERADALAVQLTREEGKTVAEARGEVDRAVGFLRYYATAAIDAHGEVYPSAVPGRHLYTQREPLGVVAAITPWNFPIAIPAWKSAPALAFGNAVVLKPSEVTPLSAWSLAEALWDAGLPHDVLQVVCGEPHEVGPALCGDPAVAALTFTGSTAVGRRLQRDAVARGIKVQTEMGGKNPVVVLDDADVAQAVEQTVAGAMRSTGQKCTATSRVIVTPGIREAFVEALLARVAALRVGDPLDAETEIGPLVSEVQRERVLGHIDAAARDGLTPAVGGSAPDRPGWFVEPTLYLDADPRSALAQEEIFGPVAAVIEAEDLDAALEIANAVPYGLAASVFTRDLGQVQRFVRGIEAGVVHVNGETAGTEPQVPFGGMKASSSHSREQGRAAAEFFTAVKTVYVDMPA